MMVAVVVVDVGVAEVSGIVRNSFTTATVGCSSLFM